MEGAVSLIGSKHVQSCVGIESVAQAVNDAKENAKMNNIHNCDFIEGKVEIVSTCTTFLCINLDNYFVLFSGVKSSFK